MTTTATNEKLGGHYCNQRKAGWALLQPTKSWVGTTATNEKLGGLRDNNYELVYDLTDFHVNGDSWEGLRMRLGYYMSNSTYDPI